MNTIGVVLLAAATATSGIGKPHVFKKVFRHHAVAHGPAPADGMITAAGMGAGMGCGFGHPGCGGGAACPGAMGAMGAMGGMGAEGMGPGGVGFGAQRRFPNVRSQVFFVDPPGMQVGWQSGGGMGDRVYLPAQLTAPARYNFTQGYIYRLKLTNIPNNPGLVLYPTIEVAPSTPATDAFLTHNPIPIQFTQEDFDQVRASNFVTKVIYLPDPRYQELAIPETLVSTRLEPGVDPIREADERGTILLIVRLGAIDLEMPTAGVSTYTGAPILGPGMAPGTVVAPTEPGTVLPPAAGTYAPAPPPAPAPAEMQPLDVAPTAPAPPADSTPAPAPAPDADMVPPPPAPADLTSPPAPGLPAAEPPAPATDTVPAPDLGAIAPTDADLSEIAPPPPLDLTVPASLTTP